jgi:TIR domain
MSFQHACFISYRNGDREDKGKDPRRQDIEDTINAFARDLRDELQRELLTQVNPRKCLVFLDQDSDCLKPGDHLMSTLGQAVCKSVCMIVIFTRHYLDHKHLVCAAELEGMLRRLNHRCETLGLPAEQSNTWIATAVFRESERVPHILKEHLYYDFTGYVNSSQPLRDNPTYRKYIKNLAKKIADFWESLDEHESAVDFCADCGTFALLDTGTHRDELVNFVKTHKIPLPIVPPRT